MTVMVHTKHDWMIVINDDYFPARVHWVCQVCGVRRDKWDEDDPTASVTEDPT